MRHIVDRAQAAKKSDTIAILLPAAYQQPEDFIAQGFVSAVRERALDMDLIMAELLFSHIADRSVLTDINSQLIVPAINAGYRNIWLAGISIGGYVAIAYASQYADHLKGVLLLAPYPGNCITIDEIQRSGGINTWNPQPIATDDTERGNWAWLKSHRSCATEVYLGYGEQDRFVTGQTMMAAAFPAENVNTMVGDHTWPVWVQLWQQFLDKHLAL